MGELERPDGIAREGTERITIVGDSEIKWGPLHITLIGTIQRGPTNGGLTRILRISAGKPGYDKDLQIYVSETGRSLRVFRGGTEL